MLALHVIAACSFVAISAIKLQVVAALHWLVIRLQGLDVASVLTGTN
jgi:hypothetical protein